MNAGAHDGLSTMKAGFDAFSGSGRDAGFVIVKSAGNERGHAGHAEVQVRNGAFSTIEWDSDNTDRRSSDYIEAWFGSSNTFEFTLFDPAERSSPVVSDSNPEAIFELGGNQCRMSVTEFHPDNGDSRLVLQIKQGTTPIQDGRWILRILGDTVIDGGHVHAWVKRDNARAVIFVTGDNDQMTLTIPGTAHSVITVGACRAGTSLELNRDSSF